MAGEDVKMDGEEAPKEEVNEGQTPILTMANWKFLLTLSDEEVPATEKAELKEKLLTHVKENDMAPYYKHLCEKFGWMEDEALLKEMTEKNSKVMAEFDEKEKDTRENLGDSEVREVLLNRADYLATIGEKQ